MMFYNAKEVSKHFFVEKNTGRVSNWGLQIVIYVPHLYCSMLL